MLMLIMLVPLAFGNHVVFSQTDTGIPIWGGGHQSINRDILYFLYTYLYIQIYIHTHTDTDRDRDRDR